MDKLTLYILTFFTSFLFVHTQEPRISNRLGEIIGKTVTVPVDVLPYRNVHQYLGIPFAQPPVGDRRFRNPEPKTYLDSPFYAQNHRAICPQTVFFGGEGAIEQNEDCLFLNVYVPDRLADKPSGHAVMIWVHGGGFRQGASNFYDGALLAATGNIIVVTINYRIGVFGFLSTGDDNAPGNFGLLDQRLAFQWVQDYIEGFGGDNQRVTIAGGSAGAISTTQHALFPDNHGLFQRIIAQSGSISSSSLDLERDGMIDTVILANSLGCPTSVAELMSCLREKSVAEILTAMQDSFANFGPIMDGHLIKINPQHITKMSEKRNLEEVEFFRSLDILSGFNAYDGALMLPFIIDPSQVETIQPTREEMVQWYLPTLMKRLYRKDFTAELLSVIEAQYTNWTNPYDYHSIRLHITKLAGDVNFAVPAIELARLHRMSSTSRNFMYHFTPVPSVRAMPTASWVTGASHADEILFMFGGTGILGVGEENAWEEDLVTKMMTYWTNFVKSGDPNSPEPMSPYWPEYTMETGDYIVLEKSMSDAKQYLYAEEANFWSEVFPDLVEAVEGKGTGSGCEETTSAAASLNISKTVDVVSVLILYFIFTF